MAKFCYLLECVCFHMKHFLQVMQQKKLIHETLAKYGISAGGKEICGTTFEPKYDKGKVKCNNYDAGTGTYANNYWSPKDRLCKSCPVGTILNKTTFQSCNNITCPEGTRRVDVENGKCPKGMDLFDPDNGICPEGYELVAPEQNICPTGSKAIKVVDGKCPEGYMLKEVAEVSCPYGFELFKQN